MVFIKRFDNTYSLDIQSEETSEDDVKLSLAFDELQLKIEVKGQNYYDAIWNLYFKLEEVGLELICNGVSLNVYPNPMQFDMGLAYQGMQMNMGMNVENKDIKVLLESDPDKFIKCSKNEQLIYNNKWVASKKKNNLKYQEIFIKSINQDSDFLFFWGHQSSNKNEITKACFSQWWPCSFKHEGIEYNSTEQWMMAEKARIFSDIDSLEEILKSNDPKVIKEIGRGISLFDENVWNLRKYDAVYEGNLMKFSQNNFLKSFLLSTENKILVEASPYDKIWGIGMKQNEEGIENPNNWKGENLLGFALMEVRDILNQIENPAYPR